MRESAEIKLPPSVGQDATSMGREAASVGPASEYWGFSVNVRPDGVAVATIDTPGASLNVLSTRFFDSFQLLLDRVDRDGQIKAVVITSGKPGNFIAGADIHEFLRLKDSAQLSDLVRKGHAFLDRVAASRKPFVAAIHGAALGAGCELALACHYRIASNDSKTIIGLPEVMVGLFPAAGGCQRLPRLIGLRKALPAMLTGQRIKARQAKAWGLVDDLTTPVGIADTAAKIALRLAEGQLWVDRRLGLVERLLMTPPFLGLVMDAALRETLRKTHANYPAPVALLECVRRGLARGFKAGQASEIEKFGPVAAGEEARNLLRLFEAMNALKKLPEGSQPNRVSGIAVIGGGFMGEGIASVSHGFCPTWVKDVSDAAIGKCAKNIRQGLDKREKSGSLTRFERDRQWHNLQFTKEYSQLAHVDLVIEAVFERLDLKRQVLSETERIVAARVVFATNTSALPVKEIAAEAVHPERVVGMHYFSPVPKMPLLEIVRGPQSADWAIATAIAFGIKQGKTCIVVNDGPGFYTSRILAPYMNEAMRVLEAGAAVEAVDKAMLEFGFPVGPIALLDEVGFDVAGHVARDLGSAFANRLEGQSTAIAALVDAGYLGRKNNRGFYRYPTAGSARKKVVNADVYTFFGGPKRTLMSKGEIVDRLALLFINEAVYCLQEGILQAPGDGDVGAILGLGFPPFRGGPFRYIDAIGSDTMVTRMRAQATRHGMRFEPAPLLVDMATRSARFYADGDSEPVAATQFSSDRQTVVSSGAGYTP